MGGEKAGDSGTGRRDHGWQSTRRDEGLYDEQFTWISSFSLQTEEREVCPVCLLSTGGGEEYKTHLRLCLENNVPRVRTNQQVLLEARGSLVCDDQIKEESAANDDLEREESEESSSSDEEEACDTRQLYPCKEKRENQYFHLLEEEEELSPQVRKSIEIMQKSCFATVDLSAGKEGVQKTFQNNRIILN